MSEEIKVKVVLINGERYLYDKNTNILYDEKTQDPIGVFNKQMKRIDYYDEDDEEEEEIEVKAVEIKGKRYLYDKNTNILYDEKTQDPIGVWNKETKKIDPYVEDEEDTRSEIDKKIDELEEEIKAETDPIKKKILTKTLGGLLKMKLKGKDALTTREKLLKTGGKVIRRTTRVISIGIQAEKIPKVDDIWKWSNPEKVAEMTRKYLGDMAVVFRSTKPKKKYMIFDPNNNKWIFFGEMGYEDFTKHQDEKRRQNYLTRTANMKGNWKDNKYSANNLSRKILWNG